MGPEPKAKCCNLRPRGVFNRAIWDYLPVMTIHELDAIGLLCPLPVLKLRKRLGALAPGEQMRLLADDPAALVDVPHFCAEAGHKLVETEDRGAVQTYLVEKGAG